MMFLQGIKQRTRKTEVTFHELVIVLGAVHTGKVEYEIGFFAPIIKLFQSRVQIILEYFGNLQFTITTGFAVLDVIKLCTKILTNKTFGTGYQYFHDLITVRSCPHRSTPS